jgi:hypothetical protein
MNICIRSLRRSVFMGSLFVLLQMQAMSAQQLAAPKRLSTAAVAAGPQATAQSVSSPPEVVPALPVPRLIKFSGVAKDASGQPDSGVAGVTFSIYAEQQGGAALWMETQNTQLDAQGHYAVLLGSSQSEGMPLSLFATGEPRWLGVKVDLPGRVEQPRVLLVSVPYALKASDADTVGGKPASAFVLAPTGSGSSSALGTDVSAPDNGKSRSAASNSQHPFTSTGTQNYIPIFTDNSGDLGNSNIFQNSSGNVGIGYTNPGQRLVIGAPAGGGLLNASNLVDQDMQVTLSAPGASDKHAYLGPSVATNLTLGVGGVERMRITNAGNVGIGYSNPQQRLVIASPTGGGLLNASNLADQDMQVTLTAPGASDKHAYVGPSVATNLTLGVGMVEMMRITNAGKVGIGTSVPAATLDVNGAVNAATTFNLGGGPFAFGSVANHNAFLGFAGNSTTTGGSFNTATGAGALLTTTGSFNTANGVQALYLDTTGDVNSAYGAYALGSNTAGSDNAAVGIAALYSNTTGGQNTAVGDYALNSNTTTNLNTAIGYQALMSNNSGYENTAIGSGALSSNTTGYFNTAIGRGSLSANTTGVLNTAVGFLAEVGSVGLTNATVIGAEAVVSASNSLVLGSSASYNGIANTNVGVDVTAPTNIFTVLQGGGHAIADGWDVYSSQRWKTNIHTIDGALGKVAQLRGVSYNLKANGKHEIGVIAEEVGNIVPEVVSWDSNGKDAQGVDYSRLTALLIEATKEQQELINSQQKQIAAQQVRMKVQQSEIAKLASEIRMVQTTLKSGGLMEAPTRTVSAKLATIPH